MNPHAVPVLGQLGRQLTASIYSSVEARQRYAEHCAARRDAEIGFAAKDQRADWRRRAALLIETRNNSREFALTEEAFDDGPLGTDEIGTLFMLAALAQDAAAIERLRAVLETHATSKADQLAEARHDAQQE